MLVFPADLFSVEPKPLPLRPVPLRDHRANRGSVAQENGFASTFVERDQRIRDLDLQRDGMVVELRAVERAGARNLGVGSQQISEALDHRFGVDRQLAPYHPEPSNLAWKLRPDR